MNISRVSSAAGTAIGQSVPRVEDPKLLRGEGRYTADVSFPNLAHAVFVRSREAHGAIRAVATDAARAIPGVLAVLTGADIAGYAPTTSALPFKNRDGSEMRRVGRPALARDKVRFVGDAVACVIAQSDEQAGQAAEAVVVDIAPLPALIDPRDAAQPGAPLISEQAPDNLVLDYHFGDAAAVAAAMASAAHVARMTMVNSRVVVSAMEPRAAIAEFDPASARWTLHVGCQGVMGMRAQLAAVLGVTADKIHVLTGNVGGSFGMKAAVYPEYVCILHAARALGRPVKWVDDRSSSFVSDNHGRDHIQTVELALDRDGRFLALRLTGFGNMGAYLGNMAPQPATLNTVRNAASLYRTPLIEASVRCVLTNTTFINPYRGAGRPEGNYYMERIIDVAAAEMGIDRVDLRRRNLIRPNQMPFKAASGQSYDSGDFPAVLRRALVAADWNGFAKRRREARKRGMLRGIGLGCYLEVTAPASKEMGGIRFEADGTVTILTGTLDYGQGHAAPFAQVLSDRLGIPFECIRLLQGDSDALRAGGGTGGSRSAMNSGAAIVEAAQKVIEQGRHIAAHVLEAAVADIEFSRGRFVIAGTDRGIDLIALAARLRSGTALPPDLPPSLDVMHVSDGVPSAYPNGAHVAEVEIDPETGVTAVVKYTSVNDFGTVINPMLVEGQVHGGVVQGIGQAILERTVYDRDGQLLTGSYMDYAIPRAGDAPVMETGYHPVPARTNPLGVKGCGEAGCAGSLTSVTNAIVDALAGFGIRHIDMPATPERVWRAIAAAKAAKSA